MLKKIKIANIKNLTNLNLENISPDFIPYACYYDKETIVTKAGEMLQVIKIVGFTHEYSSGQIDLRSIIRHAISDNIKDNHFSFWIQTVRRKLDLDPGGEFPYFFAKEMHEAWCKKNYWHDKYVNELYITIVYRNIDVSIRNLKQLLLSFSYRNHNNHYKKEFQKNSSKLNQVTDNILNDLKNYGARKLQIAEDEEGPYSEHLQFFGKIIHLSESRMPLPIVNLSKYLSTHKIAFGNVNFEIRDSKTKQFGAIFSIKEYQELSLKELDKFLQLPQEMVVTQSVNFVNSKRLFKNFKYQNYILNLSGDAEFANISGLENMLKDLNDTPTDFGNSQLTIMIIAKSLDLLEEHIKRSVDKLLDLGLLMVREDLNLENCYWSQLPGNFSFLVRNSPINTRYVGGFASLYNFPAGRTVNHWGKAVTLFRTGIGTPYFFNFHHEDIGHSFLAGPKGAGKNTLLNFLISESCKYDPKIFILDHNNRAEFLIKALGQQYIENESIKFNPFMLEKTGENIDFLSKWFLSLTYYIGQEVDDPTLAYFKDALEKFLSLEEEKNLSKFLEILNEDKEIQNQSSKDLIIKITELFSDEKFLSIYSDERLEISKVTAINIDNEDQKYNLAITSYLLRRFKMELDGTPAIIVINDLEALNKLVNIKEWLEYLTMKNAMAIISIDEEGVNLLDEVIDYIPTQIYLPHEDPAEKYQDIYKLSDNEFELFKNIKHINRHFLLKQDGTAIIAELNLSGINNILSILTYNKENKSMIEDAIQSSDNPEEWLPIFYDKIN